MIRRIFHRSALRVRAIKATALMLAILPFPLSAAPEVVVSLKPLELLVRAVATENTTVTTLVGAGQDPHNYSLRPTQRRALTEADAIFWIGPEMETFLTRMLNGEDFQSRSHALNPEKHDSTGHGNDDHNHSDGSDPHIWLDPALALGMVREVHAVLKNLPEAESAALDANLARFEKALARTESEINRQLEPARKLSLFTYHNAFTHFAEHYDLTLAGVLTPNPELSPGARHIAEVQNRLRTATRPCLMTEQPFNKESWAPIAGDLNVRFSAWDPLAADINADANGYLAFQKSLAQAVLHCL